jgi:outer membrane receptor protein involved in Fe transport
MRNLPQTSAGASILQSAPGALGTQGGGVVQFSTVGLRGFQSAQTVVLVNGRALPRSGDTNGGGADLSRIPLAAIERVEILPSAASAIYGAGAISGGINIILRRDYHGRDLTVYLGTSTEGGATEYRMNYVEGLSFNHGRGNMTLTLNYQHRNPLYARDRGFLDEAWNRYGPHTTVKNQHGVSAFEDYGIRAFGSGMIAISALQDPTATLGIPGAPNARYATIPAGLTPAQSQSLSASDFNATAGLVNKGDVYGRTVLYQPTDVFSANAQVEYDFIPKKLRGYGEFTYGRTRQDYDSPALVSTTLSDTDPTNPFGKIITLYLDAPDLPDANYDARYDSVRAVTGVRGWIGKNWEWSADFTVDYSDNKLANSDPLNALRGSNSPAALAAYNVFADHTLHPISQELAGQYFSFTRKTFTRTTLLEGNIRVTGDVFELPAGPFRTSFIGRYSHWKYIQGQSFAGEKYFDNPAQYESSSNDSTRKTWQGGFEAVIPVFSKKWRPVPVDALDFNFSASWESNKSGGTNASSGLPVNNNVTAHTYVGAVKLQITKDVALRASYSEGFYPPDWDDIGSPVFTQSVPGTFDDSARGYSWQADFTTIPPDMGFFDVTMGGNPDLRPETSKSLNYGVIFTPRFLPGVTLSVDYWKTKKKDGIYITNFPEILAHADIFAANITRAAATAEDIANGWLGKVISVDSRKINADRIETEGIDFKLRYLRATEHLGTFDWLTTITYTDKFVMQESPSVSPINTLGAGGPLRWRGNSVITWARKNWTNTLTARYTHTYRTSTNTPSANFPAGAGYDGDHIAPILNWDYQISYSVPYRTTVPGNPDTWFAGTTWTIGVLNVFNHKPAFITNGSSFYNGYDDPRQRFLYVQIKKSF